MEKLRIFQLWKSERKVNKLCFCFKMIFINTGSWRKSGLYQEDLLVFFCVLFLSFGCNKIDLQPSLSVLKPTSPAVPDLPSPFPGFGQKVYNSAYVIPQLSDPAEEFLATMAPCTCRPLFFFLLRIRSLSLAQESASSGKAG